MKKTTLLLSAILTLFIVSCSKNNDDGDNNSLNDGEAQLTINGSEFITQNTVISAVLINETMSLQFLNVQTDEAVVVSFRNPAVTTFDLGITGEDFNAGSYIVSSVAYTSKYGDGTGQLNVTSYNTTNKTISGVFEFEGFNLSGESFIVNGAFQNLNYILEINANTGGTLSAKVDGTPLNPTSVVALETTLGGTAFNIVANNESNFTGIGLTIPADITVGTHNFSSLPISGSIIGQYYIEFGGANQANFISIDGTITITSYNPSEKTMEGTFEFTAGDFLGQNQTTYAITEGAFTIDL